MIEEHGPEQITLTFNVIHQNDELTVMSGFAEICRMAQDDRDMEVEDLRRCIRWLADYYGVEAQ